MDRGFRLRLPGGVMECHDWRAFAMLFAGDHPLLPVNAAGLVREIDAAVLPKREPSHAFTEIPYFSLEDSPVIVNGLDVFVTVCEVPDTATPDALTL